MKQVPLKNPDGSANVPSIDDLREIRDGLIRTKRYHQALERLTAISAVLCSIGILFFFLLCPVVRIYQDCYNLSAGDVVLTFRFSGYDRGSQIAFSYGSDVLIRTVGGLPGDLVDLSSDGILTVNGEPVMLAHIIVDEIGEPTLFSKELVTGLLRDEMGFDGVVVTDGLGMKAMTDIYPTSEVVLRGVKAGVDMFLCPADLDEAVTTLCDAVERGEILESRIDESVLRILTMKQNHGIL